MQIYTVAMGYHPSAGVQRGQAAVAHTKLASFRCRAAVTDRDELVGFGYGYASRPGQWWHDLVDRAIAPELVPDWLGDAFELSELHVLPTVQGRGVGRRLLVDLAAVVPTRTMLLSTPDADTRAFRLYRSLGFLDLARNHRFPGDSRAFAVLGRMLPLAT
ncbi:MAG: GNAT family N-acetyltransferase [Jatrophihabitans sp.]